ncbi:alkaline phosphatase family protein [Bradyrhizobium genosp. P]|uniref:alkaline phosphatase family protein n=1 Tax=Bradyrhizobium genosp. P TaxID=83641 RepID=UPI003CEFC32E
MLSFGEPDTCSHFNGTGAAKTREAIAFCDRQLGRVIDWWEAEGLSNDIQLAVISDHAQSYSGFCSG